MRTIHDKIALVVCTKDRANYVQGFLEHFQSLEHLPATICIVDSSTSLETRRLVEGFNFADLTVTITYIHTHPGAPHQKNVGLERLAQISGPGDIEVVSFLDDDIRPDGDYFEIIESIFEANSQIACCGGFDKNLNPPISNWLRRLFWLSGDPSGGQILASGICTTTVPTHDIQRVDWVPGGMQNLRWADIADVRFDGRIRIYGDEVELQTRLVPGRWIVTSARLGVTHLAAKQNKDRVRDEQAYMDGFRWRLAAENRVGVRKFPMLVATCTLLVSSLLLYCAGRRPGGYQEFLGHVDFLVRLALGSEVQQLVSFESVEDKQTK